MVDHDPPDPATMVSAAQADRLISNVSGLSTSLDSLSARMDDTRRFTRWLAVCVAISAVSLLGVTLALIRSTNAADDAKAAAAANELLIEANEDIIHEVCEKTNEVRSGQIELWERMLALDPPTTPDEFTRADQIRGVVSSTFLQRDCE